MKRISLIAAATLALLGTTAQARPFDAIQKDGTIRLATEGYYAPPAESRDSATYMAIPPASVPFTSPIASPVASTGAIEISGAKNGCIRSFARSLSVHRIAAAASTAAMYRTGTTTPDGSR